MLNKVLLIGRIANDFTLRYTTTGKAVLRITLAVDRNYVDSTGERPTDFIICVVWGKQAETVADYCRKGMLIAVTGSMEIRKYTEQGETKERFITEVITDDVRFLERVSKHE